MSHSTAVPLSPRTGLAIAAAVTGLTLAGGATLATSLGWLRPPAAEASVSAGASAAATVSAPLPSSTGAAGSLTATDPSLATPLTHVDEAGNVWAWYGAGDWVLVTPGPPAPAPVLASGRQGRGEREEHTYQRSGERAAQGTFFSGRGHDDDD